MWKLTSRAFRKCGSFLDLEVLNHICRMKSLKWFFVSTPTPYQVFQPWRQDIRILMIRKRCKLLSYILVLWKDFTFSNKSDHILVNLPSNFILVTLLGLWADDEAANHRGKLVHMVDVVQCVCVEKCDFVQNQKCRPPFHTNIVKW